MFRIEVFTASREEQEYDLCFGQYINLMWREPGRDEWYIYNPDKLKSKEMYNLWISVDPHRQRYEGSNFDATVLPRGPLEIRIRRLSTKSDRKSTTRREDASLWTEYQRWRNDYGYLPGTEDEDSPEKPVNVSVRIMTSVNIHCPSDRNYYTLREPNGEVRRNLRPGSYEVIYMKELKMKIGYVYSVSYTVSVTSTSSKIMSKTFTEDVYIKDKETESITIRSSEDFFFDDWI